MTTSMPSSIVVCGLPSSGKTTFLAALWHLVQSKETNTALTLESLVYGQYEYVNAIRERWLKGRQQTRTVGDVRKVGIDLKSSDDRKTRLLFLDHSGETFDQLWETRACSSDVAAQLQNRSGTLLFLRPEGIKAPLPLADLLTLEEEMKDALPSKSQPTATPPPSVSEWMPNDAPDQVKIVDLLQSLTRNLKSPDKERLAVFVSAWDLVCDFDSAESFVTKQMPLLNQYLLHADHDFDIRFYALSAQGGEYVEENYEGTLPEDLIALLALDEASYRVRLMLGSEQHHDLTLPLEWLIS